MTQIMSHGFHTCDSVKHMIGFMSFNWLKDVKQLPRASQLIDFTLQLTMSHQGYVTRGDESPELGLWEDNYIRGLVPTKR